MSFGLDGKIAVVTGPGGFLKGYVHALAGAGARVVIATTGVEGQMLCEELRGIGSEAVFVETDVTSEESTLAMARTIAESFGHLDVLVNNAALFQGLPRPPVDPIETMPLERWHQVLDMNLTGTLLAVRAVIPLMSERGGVIVNQTSPAVWANSPGRIHYTVSKGAILPLTRSMARELGPRNIRVNAIAPGAATTGDPAELSPEAVEQMTGPMCLKRVGTPNDLVGPLLFLAGDLSSWMSGQVLVVDGGAFMLG